MKSKLKGSPLALTPAIRKELSVMASTVPLKIGEMGAEALSSVFCALAEF